MAFLASIWRKEIIKRRGNISDRDRGRFRIYKLLICEPITKSPLKKRCRILPAGGLGVSPSFKSPPRLGDVGVD